MKNLLHVHARWLHWEPWGFDNCIEHDRGVTYQRAGGFSFSGPGGTTVSLHFSAETDHSSSSRQCIEADGTISKMPHVTRPDFHAHRATERHYYWGDNKGFTFENDAHPAHVFYTY